jgi:ABC-type multidrug transport system fused ATPase/permease subunit
MFTWKKRLNSYGLSNYVIILLVVMAILSTIAELIGIGIFLPIFEMLKDGSLVEPSTSSSNLVLYIYNIFQFFGVEFSLALLLLTSFIFFLFSKVFIYAVNYVRSYYLGFLIKKNRDMLLDYYLNTNASFYDKFGVGDFINSSSVEMSAAINGSMIPIKFIVSIITALGSMILLSILSLKLTTISFIVVIISLVIPSRWIKATTSIGKKNSKYNSTVTSFLHSRLHSPRLIRLSRTSKAEIQSYAKITEKQRVLTLAIHVLKARVELILEPIIIGSSLLMLYIAIKNLDLPLEVVMLYMVILLRLVPVIKTLLSQKQSMNRAKGPIQAVDELLELLQNSRQVINTDSFDKNSKDAIQNIELKNICFSYDNTHALSNINLSFESGKFYAIVGPSGGGKSTLIDVVSGYRHQDSGFIFINGEQLNAHSNCQILSKVSFVPQDPQIFKGTIRSHISYGVDNSSEKQILKAADLSGAYEFINKLPNGLDTLITANASNLSGGQRQRLDLSRALLKNSSLLILDEPTANLDHRSEEKFMKTIRYLASNTDIIIIIIAHRLHTIRDADKIIVLEDGHITGTGSHSKLILENSWYSGSL